MFTSRGICLFLISIFSAALLPFCSSVAAAQSPASAVEWQSLENGMSIGSYEILPESAMLPSSVTLLKIPLLKFRLQLVKASDLSRKGASVYQMVKHVGGLGGINAHFFEPSGKPLGLLIRNHNQEQNQHKGGNVLTGVFFVKGNTAKIVHRSNFVEDASISLALQSGPRLIVDGKPSKVSSSDDTSRRSGIAVTKDGSVIIYATKVRFPGATLSQIQQMLTIPALEVVDALNLDGGGSSQLYISKTAGIDSDISISGGDNVPVALVVSAR